jgi:hypothetical protein
MSEVKCIYGSSTGCPCPRPGTVPFWEDEPSGLKLCQVHAALAPLRDEVSDLGIALEVFNEWVGCAEELDNRPLLALLEGAKTEFAERKAALEEQLGRVETAIR